MPTPKPRESGLLDDLRTLGAEGRADGVEEAPSGTNASGRIFEDPSLGFTHAGRILGRRAEQHLGSTPKRPETGARCIDQDAIEQTRDVARTARPVDALGGEVFDGEPQARELRCDLLDSVLVQIGGHDLARVADRLDDLRGLPPATRADVEDTFAMLRLEERSNELCALFLHSKRAFLVAGERSRIADSARAKTTRRYPRTLDARFRTCLGDPVGQGVAIEVDSNPKIERGGLRADGEKPLRVRSFHRSLELGSQPVGHRERGRRRGVCGPLGGDAPKDRVRETPEATSTLVGDDRDGIVDDGMGRHASEMQELKGRTEQRCARPIVDPNRASRVAAEGGIEVGNDA